MLQPLLITVTSLSCRLLQLIPCFSATGSTSLWVSHVHWLMRVSRSTLKISKRNCILQPWLLKLFSLAFLQLWITWLLFDYFFWTLAPVWASGLLSRSSLKLHISYISAFMSVYSPFFYFLLPTIPSSSACPLVCFPLMFYLPMRILSLAFQLGFCLHPDPLMKHCSTAPHCPLNNPPVNKLFRHTHVHTPCKITADSKSSWFYFWLNFAFAKT